MPTTLDDEARKGNGRTLAIDCREVRSQAAFWQRYLDAARPPGAHVFGANLDAFADALRGGPGWPAVSALHFTHTRALALAAPEFLAQLRGVAASSPWVRVLLHEDGQR